MKKNTLLEASRIEILLRLIVLSILFFPVLSAFNWNDGRLISYYNFNEGTGTNLDNVVNHIHNGTTINMDNSNWVDGILGNSLNFNGINELVNITNSSGLYNNNLITISFWFYPETNHTTSQVFFDGLPGRNYHQIQSSAWDFRMGGLTNIFPSPDLNNTIIAPWWSLNNWHHIVLVYDKTGTNQFWADGVSRRNSTTAWTPADNLYTYLGGHTTLVNFFDGRMDELGIWNRSLTSIDIGELYNSGIGLNYTEAIPSLIINLFNPADGISLTTTINNFTAYYNSTSLGYNLVNTTYYLWYSNGSIFNNTHTITFTGTSDSNSTALFTFTNLGDYVWNTYVCIGNGYPSNCSFSASNFSFSYRPFSVTGELYNTPVIKSSSQSFYLNITLGSGFQLSYVNLVYNGTNYQGTYDLISGNSYQLSRTITVPSVTTSTNYTFYWNITMEDGTKVNSTLHNQTVTPIGLDDCSVYTFQILNLTLFNEKLQSLLVGSTDNTTIKVDIDIYPTLTSTNSVIEYYHLYNQTNPARVCSSINLINSTFYMDVNINYDADGYSSEYYNIQRYNLNSTSGTSQNIHLYDLMDAESQSFKISYKDSSFLPVQNALINIQRKYIHEGVFKTVEIPKTDAYGETIGNLVVNNEIYNFVVSKNGVILGSFNDMRVVCQNPTIYECSISLNSFSSSIPINNFTQDNDFYYYMTFNKTSRVVTATFTVLSGAVSTIILNVTKEDALSTFVCSDSLITSGGSLTCTIPSSFGNSTAKIKLYKDGLLIGYSSINLSRTPSDLYNGFAVFLGIFIIITLIGASMSNSPVFTIIFLMVGVILLFALNMVSHNGFIGGGATILFLIVAIVLIIIKGSKRE